MYCRNCGTPYSGGVVCERCGTRYTDEELNEYASMAGKAKSSKSPVVIILIIVAVMGIIGILGVLAAIFVPAFIGYQVRSREAQEMVASRQEANSAYYEENASYDEERASYSEGYACEDDAEESVRGVDKNEYMKENGVYQSGTYECGVDIPEGEYIVVSSGGGYGDFYFGVYTQSDCSDESELYGNWYQGNMYVKLSEGQFVHFAHATMYDPEVNDVKVGETSYGAMYKVGKDIEPGRYLIKSTEEGYGCEYTIYSSLDAVIPVVRDSNYCDFYDSDSVLVELSEGEYISLSFGKLEKE
ncbi:MAG: hypothetical protein J6A58_13730 [Oscillospiraceae bacterium]|nr:hypothetical protein [Oscillospiraceae bacterium]